MRILQVYRDYFSELPGGIERHVHELAHGFGAQHQVEVLAAGRRRRKRVFVDSGVTVHMAAELARFQGVPLCPGFPRVVSRGRYDVVHVHSPHPTGELSFLLARHNAVGVATYHADTGRGALVAPVYRALLHRVLSSCARVIASSQGLVGRSPVLARLAETHPDKITIVPMGVDTQRFSVGPTARSEELRARWRPPIVLFVGRLRYYKGLPQLIEAVAGLDARLVIVGDGLERERVVSLGQRTLGERFVHVPFAEDAELPDIYRAADVFCLPSTSSAEAFGLAAVEAMACGVPVITTEVGTATSEVNCDGETGFVVPPADTEALRTAIDKVVADPDLAARLGDAGRSRASDYYDRAGMLDRIGRIYEDAAHSAR